MTLEDRVKQLEASIADPDVRAATVVAFVRAALSAESLAEERVKVEALVARRREQAAERQRRHREELSRAVTVTARDQALPTVTERDVVSPAPPSPSGSSLSLLPDPERAIPGLQPFPVTGGTELWHAPASLLSEHEAAFPHIDVLAEYRKVRAWCVSNPARQKTPRGMPAALFRWLSNGQDKGTATKRQAAPQNAASAKPSALAVYCDWHKDARNDKRPNQFKPKDDCPSCKHLRAASRPREDNSQLALGGRS